MSMKGGAAGPSGGGRAQDDKDLLTWERPAFMDGSEFSFNRYIAHVLQGQPEELIQQLLRKYPEGLLGAMPTSALLNAARKLSQELQDPDHGAFAQLGSYPCGNGEYAWDDHAERADTELLSCILVDEERFPEIEAVLARIPPETIEDNPELRAALENYFKSILDHSARYIRHVSEADRLYLETADPGAKVVSNLPEFLQNLDRDAVVVERTVFIANILPAALGTTDGQVSAGQSSLTFPPFRSPFEEPGLREKLTNFEDLSQRFKEGDTGLLYNIRDLVAEIEDPALQELCLEIVKKVEEEKLAAPGRSLADVRIELDVADLNRLPALARKIEQFEKTLNRQSTALMENLQRLEQGPKTLSFEPVVEDVQTMVRHTAELRKALEDFKLSPSVQKYEELAQMAQDMELAQQGAAPELEAYNRDIMTIALEHQRAVEEQKRQIALQMEELAPKTSGPAMVSGSGAGGFG